MGDPSVTRVTTAALDDQWRPVPGSEEEVEIDTLCLGFGLIPNTRLARLLGCEIVYDPARGGHVPVHDGSMQTSRAGVFVAGETAGIAGAKAAQLQGTIAGTAAALQLGKGDPSGARKRIEGATRDLKSEMRFARSLNEVFSPRAGILDLLTDDTVLCRCEEITVGQLRNGRPDWMSNLDAVRTVKRVGMGNCQGAMCETLVAQLLARETGKPITELGSYHVRPPLKPVPAGILADLNLALKQSASTTQAH
jgi:NAD(P)H-nitrite reductase large subunit